ncbi:hypothetical protein [Paenibacillus ihuae]|uniref:hypothetical protein n=1 Tax=Paenibacillus ihuae TaxID=1232431 RepID=UPI0006D5B69E|nr:hypothetical protein [Paenibacillus ihuae]
MRKIVVIRTLLLCGLMLILNSACSSGTLYHTYTYSGEGEHWSAIYSETLTEKPVHSEGKATYYQPSSEYAFQLAYKGKSGDLKKIKKFTFGFDAVGHGSSQTMEGPIRLESLRLQGSGDGLVSREESIIKVSVDWDGQSEQFELLADGNEPK